MVASEVTLVPKITQKPPNFKRLHVPKRAHLHWAQDQGGHCSYRNNLLVFCTGDQVYDRGGASGRLAQGSLTAILEAW